MWIQHQGLHEGRAASQEDTYHPSEAHTPMQKSLSFRTCISNLSDPLRSVLEFTVGLFDNTASYDSIVAYLNYPNTIWKSIDVPMPINLSLFISPSPLPPSLPLSLPLSYLSMPLPLSLPLSLTPPPLLSFSLSLPSSIPTLPLCLTSSLSLSR